MTKPAVFKPTLPPLIVVVLDSSLMIVGSKMPELLLGVILGAAILWLILSTVSVRNNVVERWPKARVWFPFLDSTGGVARQSELMSTHVEGLTLRIVDAAVDSVIVGKTFDRCVIHGPAWIMAAGMTVARNPVWKIKRTDSFFVESTKELDGVIILQDCTFNECHFENIGVVGPSRSDFIAKLNNAEELRLPTPPNPNTQDSQTPSEEP